MKSRSVIEHFSSVRDFEDAMIGPQSHFAAIASEEKAIETFRSFKHLKVAMDKEDKNSSEIASFKDDLKLRKVNSESKIDADHAHDLHTHRHILMSDTGNWRKICNSSS